MTGLTGRRRNFFLLLAAAAAVCAVMTSYAASARRDLESLRAKQKEVRLLKDEYLRLKNEVSSSDAGPSRIRPAGIVQSADDAFRALGLDRKVKSVKPSAAREVKFGVVEEAEIQAEKLTLNETVNLLYRLENGPSPLVVRKALIKTSFENPSLLNVVLTAGLIKQK